MLRCAPQLHTRTARLLLMFLLGIGSTWRRPFAAEAVRCYCTDEGCEAYGVCEADVCIVGLLKANNDVIRSCGDEPLGCQHNVGKWSDVCACSESFCNSLSYLRESSAQDQDRGRDRNQIDDDLIFHRMDRPYESASFDDPSQYESISSRTSLLTLLLIIVPLSVGAATVLVVSFNYYCHLC